jgi:abortive infection bacteriophage resistance protein
MKNHTDFILSPITDILKDVVTASAGIGSGIETYPLYDYIMQSVFLKMTGFQEQKMKCICWELATNDYEYRYTRFSKSKLGECSCYSEKNVIYKDLIEQIKKIDNNFTFQIDKHTKLVAICRYIKKIFVNTNLSIWAQCEYNEFEEILMDKISNNLDDNKFLFDNADKDDMNSNNHIRKIYNHLYRHRNKCAHNTQSYQQNLPTLKILADEGYKYENYFVWFAILVLIDKIFIELYKKYLTILEDKI